MARFVKRFGHLAKETGASMVEYTLLVALIAAVAIGALVFLGGQSKDSLCGTGNAIANPTSNATYVADDCDPSTP